MRELTVGLGKKSYNIYIENGLLNQVNHYVGQVYKGKKILIISDDNVFPLYGEKLVEDLSKTYECISHVIPHGEQSKTLAIANEIYGTLADASFSRSDMVLALGGGVVGDLAGFVAATFLRGIKFMQIPTTLLAQVDSSVGGKVAVDLPQGKNLVGNFYQPMLVLIDPLVLDTLTPRFFLDGMGEVIKYGCIQSKSLFEQLKSMNGLDELKTHLTDIIYECVDCKRIVVEEDEKDTGIRMILNFGHTLAHAIEQYYQYDRESHGEAVAIGMYQIMQIAEKKGIVEVGLAAEIKEILVQYGLPYESDIEQKLLLDAIQKDKKNFGDVLNIILLKEIGESYIYQTNVEFFA